MDIVVTKVGPVISLDILGLIYLLYMDLIYKILYRKTVAKGKLFKIHELVEK